MTIGKTVEHEFNRQINEELYSAYLYLAMAAWSESHDLQGMAAWMRKQANEEVGHAMRFFDHINERDGKVVLEALEKPKGSWKGPLEVFEASLAHERHITARIHGLMELAAKEKDHAAASFLKWFVDEQVEEEAAVSAVVAKLKMAGDMPGAMLMLDAQLGKRE